MAEMMVGWKVVLMAFVKVAMWVEMLADRMVYYLVELMVVLWVVLMGA